MNNNLRIIGIHGHAGTGKDTVALNFIQKHNFYGRSFADPLKAACSAAFGISKEDFYLPDRKEIRNEFWGCSPREIAQFVGTELFRDHSKKLTNRGIGNNFWVNRMEREILSFNRSVENLVIPDVRFQNEYDWIINHGGHIIHITRPEKEGKVGIANHSSESGIDLWHPERNHHIFNGGSIEELLIKSEEILELIKQYPNL